MVGSAPSPGRRRFALGSATVTLALASSCALPSYETSAEADCHAVSGNGVCDRGVCPTDL